MLPKLSRLRLAPWKVRTAVGFSRESTKIGWLNRRLDGVMGVPVSLSFLLLCEPNFVTIGVGDFSVRPPSRPARLMVLTFRVIPDESPPPFSWSCCLRLFLHNKNRMPPTIAIKATNPPATPPAIAATLVLDSVVFGSLEASEADEVGVMTTVRVTTTPLSVTRVGIVTGCSVWVGVRVEVAEGFWLCVGC